VHHKIIVFFVVFFSSEFAFCQKEGEKKKSTHPPRPHGIQHLITQFSWFAVVLTSHHQPKRTKIILFLLLSLLDYYRSWEADDRSIITAKSRLGRTGFF
jgi:hypothetical protein